MVLTALNSSVKLKFVLIFALKVSADVTFVHVFGWRSNIFPLERSAAAFVRTCVVVSGPGLKLLHVSHICQLLVDPEKSSPALLYRRCNLCSTSGANQSVFTGSDSLVRHR
ncbi:hypothetical protein AMECASPLE_011881 [Ameca splendens]|uniref:Secreted protein n=1 Tax=Ameca splendens TaxID=208324 RepID=A0ABV0ZWR9_9TELE